MYQVYQCYEIKGRALNIRLFCENVDILYCVNVSDKWKLDVFHAFE